MDDIMKLLEEKKWGDPFPGSKIFSHRVRPYLLGPICFSCWCHSLLSPGM